MLILLIKGIYKAGRSEGLIWYDVRTNFHEDW
jgi:hypothetical protein